MEAMQHAQAALLAPTGLTTADLEQALSRVAEVGVDDADLYFQYSRQEGWAIEDGVVREGSHDIGRGVGVRAVQGERTGFAYSDELTTDALREAGLAARGIVRAGAQGAQALPSLRADAMKPLYPAIDPVASLEAAEKVALLQRLDRAARAADPRVTQVMASVNAVHEVILVAALDGTLQADVRPLVRLNVTVIAEQNGRREHGSAGRGGRHDLKVLQAEGVAEALAQEAVRQALVNLEAQEAPAGTFDVLLASGWPGILLHEAVGHGLEGDFNRKGTSAFSGRIGEQVASPLCTVVDDGTLDGRRGSLSVDDEGTPTQHTTLIEHGVLKGYMQDRMNARLMGMARTGNGRRESYAHLPMPRMTNTYMLAGESDPEEMLQGMERGLYAVNFGGGQVDITSGKFVFSANEAYWVERGKIQYPVKGATLIGNGPDVLTRVDAVGNDLKLDPGIGTCGKEGQSVPVGVGQPSLRVRGITIGGTRA
jgi:TldD protein